MEKTYKLENLGCANCAAKMEKAIRKLEGVEEANVNFMTQKLYIRADESRLTGIMEKAVAIIRKVEPDCAIKM